MIMLILLLPLISLSVTVVSLSGNSALEHQYVLRDVDMAMNRLHDEYDSLSLVVADGVFLIPDHCITLVCEDDGVGVKNEDKERIFEQGVEKNTGMGLFLSREILLITGISILENGIAGSGARFEIRIPNRMWRFKTT